MPICLLVISIVDFASAPLDYYGLLCQLSFDDLVKRLDAK
jgi:hypothetical protein